MDLITLEPPYKRPVRVLSLDGDRGGANPFGQIRIIRAFMEDIWRRDNPGREPTSEDIDRMLPHRYFDLIVGTGTGGVIAVYLGRFRLTIRQCQDAYEELVTEVLGHPYGWEGYWYSYGNRYDYRRLESIIQKQTKRYLPDEPTNICDICDHDAKTVLMREMSPSGTGCRVAVLAIPADNIQSVRVLRTYQSRKATNADCYIWEAIRATTASRQHFPQIVCAGERFMATDAGYMNPASVANDEVWRAFGHHNIACLISIGNGKRPPGMLSGHGWDEKARALWLFLRTGNPDQIDVLWKLAMDCEYVHEDLGHDVSLRGKYFRFNLDAQEGLWNIIEWSQENKELVLQKVGKTKLEVNLAAQSDARDSQSDAPQSYLEDLNTQQAIADAVKLL